MIGVVFETVVAGAALPGCMPGCPGGDAEAGGWAGVGAVGAGDCGPASGGEVPLNADPERWVKLPTGCPLGPMVGPA